MDFFDVLDAQTYTRSCCVCGTTWQQTLLSEASKDICSQECQDEEDRRRDEWLRNHVCNPDDPYCCRE